MNLNVCTLVGLRYHTFSTHLPYPYRLFPWVRQTREERVVQQGVAWQGGAQQWQGMTQRWQGVAWRGAAQQRHKVALCGVARQKVAWQKIILIESFHWCDPPSGVALCAAVMPVLHPIPTLWQHVRNKLHAGVLLVAPSIVECNAVIEYVRAIQQHGAMKTPRQPPWLHPLQGNNGSAAPTSLIPLLIPFA